MASPFVTCTIEENILNTQELSKTCDPLLDHNKRVIWKYVSTHIANTFAHTQQGICSFLNCVVYTFNGDGCMYVYITQNSIHLIYNSLKFSSKFFSSINKVALS